MKIFIIVLLNFAVSFAFALDVPASNLSEEVSAKARKREYPGGGDEEDIKVQENLVNPLLMINKQSVQKEVYKKVFEEENATSSSDGETQL